MHNFTESIVEDATLSWFKELGYEIGHGPEIAPEEPAAERDALSETVLAKWAWDLILAKKKPRLLSAASGGGRNSEVNAEKLLRPHGGCQA